MGKRALGWLAGVLLAVGCAQPIVEESTGSGESNVTADGFNKDSVLTDAELRDATSLSAAEIQGFLEKTPWGHASVLATYEENGKSAATIIHDVSVKNRINPLELLVRLQMEQSLIYKKTASDKTISLAFGCGCPHSPVCSPAYEGFENQAECAAGTLSRSIDRASTDKGTTSGWKTGGTKKTQDGISITPDNAATAALYTYTPWVGEAGGGKKGVGGAGLHYQVWERFAESIGYVPGTGATKPPTPVTPPDTAKDAGTTTPPAPSEPTKPADPPKPSEPSSPEPNYDAGAPSSPSSPSSPAPGGGSSSESPKPEDDDDVLSENNTPPPASDPPPPSRSRSTSSSDDDDDDDSDNPPAKKPKKKQVSSGGCSTTSNGGSHGVLPLLLALGVVASRRRKRA